MLDAKPLRLLYVTARAPFGPGETYVLDEIRAMRGLGHDVRIVPMRPRGGLVHALARELLPLAEPVALLSPHVLAAALRELLRAPRTVLGALRLLLTPQPFSLLRNLVVFPKALWLARRARELRIDHIHAHWATSTAAMAMAAAHVAGIPWSFTAHGYDLLADDLFAHKARQAAFARVISADGLAYAVDRCGAPREKLVRLPMGVPLPPPLADEPLPPRAALRVLVPARLDAEKGHDVLLQAAARVGSRLEIWLAGDGALRAAVAHLAYSSGVPVRVLGHVPHERLLAFYRLRMVDAAVLASRREGIPVALMEAMAFGIPVIGTTVGGVPELLGDGAGLLVPPGDPAALAEALARLTCDPVLRRELAVRGRRRIAERFALAVTSRALAERFSITEVFSRSTVPAAPLRARSVP